MNNLNEWLPFIAVVIIITGLLINTLIFTLYLDLNETKHYSKSNLLSKENFKKCKYQYAKVVLITISFVIPVFFWIAVGKYVVLLYK